MKTTCPGYSCVPVQPVDAPADVVVLGWRLGFLADKLRENKLAAIGVLPKRYAELERIAVFVSSIIITPIGKDEI